MAHFGLGKALEYNDITIRQLKTSKDKQCVAGFAGDVKNMSFAARCMSENTYTRWNLSLELDNEMMINDFYPNVYSYDVSCILINKTSLYNPFIFVIIFLIKM